MDTVESASRVSMTEPLSPTVSFFVSNFHHLIPIQLTEHNYTIWKLQCEGALKATSLFDYVQDYQSPTITDPATTSFPNPTYLRRFVVESHIRSCLISTLSPSILAQVTHTRTALELWNQLKHKFTKSNSAGIFPGEFQSRRIAASQLVSPVICQICADSGHGASNCRYRSVRSFRPVKARLDATKASNFASDPSGDKVFDTSPHRDFVATADSTGSVFVPLAQETTMLSEPDMLVLNQSNSRFVKDRVLLSLEEMIGYQIRQGSGSLERITVQKKLETQTFEAKKIILMTKPGTDPCGTTRETLPPPPPTDAETTMESLPPTGAGTTRETLPPPPPTGAETTMESLPPTGARTTRETLPPPPPTGAETTMESLPPTGAGTTRETLPPPPPPTGAETTMESLPPTGAGTTRETLPPPPVGASYLTPYFSKTNKIIWKCAICQVNCVQDQQLQNHLQGEKHKAFELYRELEGKSLQSNKELNAGDTKQNDDQLENVVLEMTVQKGKYECQIGTDASIEEAVDDHKNRRRRKRRGTKEASGKNNDPEVVANDDTQETQKSRDVHGVGDEGPVENIDNEKVMTA